VIGEVNYTEEGEFRRRRRPEALSADDGSAAVKAERRRSFERLAARRQCFVRG
jgi:hypothetical protein